MANVLYDFTPRYVLTPYVGAGVGIAFIDGNSSVCNTAFAYQGMLGIAVNFTEQLRFGIEGRYVGSTNVSVNVPVFGSRTYNQSNLFFFQAEDGIRAA